MKRNLAICLLLALASPPAWAQQAKPGWTADPATKCRVWNANPHAGETVKWSGSCARGLAQGQGVLQWFQDGKPASRYDGDYRDGKPNGHGLYIGANGEQFEGQYKDGMPDGMGTLRLANGEVYVGNWSKGCFHLGDRRAWINTTEQACKFR